MPSSKVAELCRRRDDVQKELTEGEDRKRTLAQSISDLQEGLKRARVDSQCTLQQTEHDVGSDSQCTLQPEHDVVSAEFRKKDAARKRAEY
ncbi:unnamed protein product [Calypogeia fissa]